jgi:hypothetical protein
VSSAPFWAAVLSLHFVSVSAPESVTHRCRQVVSKPDCRGSSCGI